MAQLDLDDLPPRIAALLCGLPEGEELLLVQHGAVVSRFAAQPAPAVEPAQDIEPDERVAEVFETFRAAIEDEF